MPEKLTFPCKSLTYLFSKVACEAEWVRAPGVLTGCPEHVWVQPPNQQDWTGRVTRSTEAGKQSLTGNPAGQGFLFCGFCFSNKFVTEGITHFMLLT